MEIVRLSCYLFTVLQLVEISIGKSVKGKPRSATSGKSSQRSVHKEKAVYGQIYEDTKNDVNRAIENAILEASKKATDMVLDPKVQNKLIDQVTSQAAASSGDEERLIEKSTGPPKKHTHKHKKRPVKAKAAAKEKVEDDSYEDAGNINSDDALQKSAFKEEDKEVPGHISEEEEVDPGSSPVEQAAAPAPKKHVKHVKKADRKKPTQYDDELNVIDATDSSGNSEDEPADNGDSDTDTKSELIPPLAESKADDKTVAAEEKEEEKEGQEDLKQLLDESITNLIKANSAVEVLLRATNMRKQADLQQYLKNKCRTLPCARISAPALPQPVLPQPVPQPVPQPARPVLPQPFPGTCTRCYPHPVPKPYFPPQLIATNRLW